MTINQPGIKVLPFHLAVKLMDLVRKKSIEILIFLLV